MVSITDPDNNVTSYAYDNANRLITVTDPLGHETHYAYDADGEVTSITDRDDRTRTFAYNDLGLKTEEDWLDSESNVVRTITWTYDDSGNLMTTSDPDSSYAFTYDLGNHVTSVDNEGTPNVPHVVLDYTYDIADNHVISMSDNLGHFTSYGYANDRLSNISTFGTISASVSFSYDTIGRPITIDRSGSSAGSTSPTIRSSYAYDDADRLTDITHQVGTGSSPTILSQFSYAYDAFDRLTSYSGPEGELAYNYDNTSQLTGVSGDRTEDYSYDANGNRTMEGYTIGDGNRLLSDGTYDYTYDNEGNTLTKVSIADGSETDYTWDYWNRLTGVVQKDGDGNIILRETNTYDMFSHRIGVSVDFDGDGSGAAVQRWTVFDGDHPYMDFDGDGHLTTRYLWGTGEMDQLFAKIVETGDIAVPEAVDWYLTDNLGSVRQLVASDGTVLNDLDYDSYGSITVQSHFENADRFDWAGGELDEATGYQVHHYRWYDPATGRWISQDPIQFAAGDLNVDRYVGNGPTNAIDANGLGPVNWKPKNAPEAAYGPPGMTAMEFDLWLQQRRSGPPPLPPMEDTNAGREKAFREIALRNGVPEEYIQNFLDILHQQAASPNATLTKTHQLCNTWAEAAYRDFVTLNDWKNGVTEVTNGGIVALEMEIFLVPPVRSTFYMHEQTHTLVKITFDDGTVVYVDNTWMGGRVNIHFPDEVPSRWRSFNNSSTPDAGNIFVIWARNAASTFARCAQSVKNKDPY